MIDYSKFNVILDASDKDFVDKLRKALELSPGEKLEITTPQFKRIDGRVISYLPNTPEEYKALPKLDSQSLIKIGCQKWEIESSLSQFNGQTLWLFPYEWYDCIPNGTKIVDINGELEEFRFGKTDNDIRCGALAFGFTQRM